MYYLRMVASILAVAIWIGPAAAQAPAPSPKAPTTRQRTAPPPAAKANEYATESEAKQRCGADPVVWANPASKIYHLGGTRDYGKTKRGAYMCKNEAEQAKYRAVKAPRSKAKT